ncbi:MAG: hypothetical protein JO122_21440, partial [Acetobacteraceae bacterium]|nr:hypothetical protein [Acetobacteraceae bacterium]
MLPKRRLPNRHDVRVPPQRFLEVGTHSDPAEQVQPEPGRSVDGLAAGIAHDFNNLLTVMLGNATVVRMRAEAQGDAQIARRAAQIEKAAERGGRLVAQLLAYARQQMLQAEDVRLPQLLADLQVLLARAAGERVRLNISCAPLLWRCRVDPEQLESALLNLVINARDAMPEGGSISICASNRSVTPAGARGMGCEPGDYVKVEVRDTGCGIPPALQGRVFEPFFTTKPIGQGSGLGLAQVQGFVRQSRGWVELQSQPGEGTCICLMFPRARSVRQDLRRASQARSPGRRILVVTDDAIACDTLADAGYEVLTAADAAAAETALQESSPPDILLTNLILPDGGSGLTLAQEARRRLPKLHVLLTASPAQDVAPGMPTQGFALLPKPYQPDELLRVIDGLFCEYLVPEETEAVLGALRERPRFDKPAYVSSLPLLSSTLKDNAIRLGVMPIRTLGRAPDAEIAVGLAEEITSALSRFRWVTCIAPASVAAVAAEKLGQTHRWRQLNLDFVFEATLLRDHEQVRLTVRLIDLHNNAEVVWGRSFEGAAADLSRMQHQIAAETVARVAPEVLLRAGDQLAARPVVDPSAYHLMLRAIPAIYRLDRTGFEPAGALLMKSIRLDADNAAAHAWLAHWYLFLVGQGWAEDAASGGRMALDHAERAAALDPEDARGLTTAGHIRAFLLRDPHAALGLHGRALAINPNLPLAWCYRGLAHTYVGEHANAVSAIQQAQSLSPFDPHGFFFEMALSLPYLLTGEYGMAARRGRRALELHPGLSATLKSLLSALGHLGMDEEAA